MKAQAIDGLVLALALASLAAIPTPTYAKEKGDGSFRVEYQYVRTGEFDSSVGDIDIGNTDGHTLMFSFDYALSDRMTVRASLPWVKRRHTGALPHDPVADITAWDPPNKDLLDDGNYHTDWQDLFVGVSYVVKEGPVTLEPFISIGVPTNDYQFYAHAAVGKGLWHVPVGVSVHYEPPLSDFYTSGSVAYVIAEKTLGVDVSYWLVGGTFGYFVTPRFVPKIFFSMKDAKGLSFPDDFDVMNLNDEKWYHHDQIIKHNYLNAGVGFDYIINENYQVSADWFTMVKPDQVNVVERAWSFSLTHSFSRKNRR